MKRLKITEGDLRRIVSESIEEVIRKDVMLSGDRAGEETEYDTEQYYPSVMGRCKLAMNRFSAQIGNLGHLAMCASMAERQDWVNHFREVESQLEQMYDEHLLPIYRELENMGVKPMVNGELYTD